MQRAYQDLARQGLVVSRPGQGTRVASNIPADDHTPLRGAALVHRAETFLLEALTAGHDLGEVEQAIRLALDHWRVDAATKARPPTKAVRFVGSHDLAIDWLAAHFSTVSPSHSLELHFTGSLGGLMALARGEADLAGSHLWDEETGTYNLPFVCRILPNRRVVLAMLAHHRLGLILPPGNPDRIQGLPDLTRRGVPFINRQPGFGTRVWLDATLKRLGIPAKGISGYTLEEQTHSGVARAVAERRASVGLGLEAAALAFGLDFVFLAEEPYHLVIPAAHAERPPLKALLRWLGTRQARQALAGLGGYATEETGRLTWVG